MRRLVPLALLLPIAAAAQGRSAAVVLELPASARAAAMGDAMLATGDDAAAIFYNPALLAGPARASGALSVERYLAGATLGAASGAVRLGVGTLGIGVLALDYPDAAEIVPDPAYGGDVGLPTGATISGTDLVAGAAYAIARGRVRGGVGTRWVGQYLPGARGGSAAADAGVAVDVAERAWGRVTVAGALQHLGGRVATNGREAELPRAWRAGAALTHAPGVGARWSVAAEAGATRGGAVRARGGVEGAWTVRGVALLARAGVVAREDGARQSPLTVGGGLGRGPLALDYAWRRFADDLGGTHRIGVRWSRPDARE